MRSLVAFGAAAVLSWTGVAVAATCSDLAAPSIVAPADSAGAKCLSTVTKSGGKYLKTVMGADTKCNALRDPFGCPNAKDETKKQKIANKAADKIAKVCTDAAQAGLASSYGDTADETRISSCLLSQHRAVIEVMADDATGAPSKWANADCMAGLGKAATKVATSAHKAITKCVNAQVKAGNPADLGPICVGSWSGGAFVAPTDTKAAAALAKAFDKAEALVASACDDVPPSQIPRVGACGGGSTVADLQNCAVCANFGGVVSLLDQSYNEDGTFVSNGPGALQAAIDAASAGDRLLIASGDYAEEVVVNKDGIGLVGCGAATDNRPRVIPPGGPGPFINGILASNQNDLLFQSLEVFDWDENGILVTGADGVTFRDIVGDGNVNSTYAVFPVQSNNVLVEGCYVTAVTDAGIYVGQSTNIVVRHNRVNLNVAGIEIENSANADVHGNIAYNNTGGILVFKLPGPPVQLSNDHDVHHNVSVNNNTPNFADPGTTVSLIPDGTGFFIISNDSTTFHDNLVEGNGSFGMALIDQEGINALVGAPVFDPTSADQTSFSNHFYRNLLLDNGEDEDTSPPNAAPLGGQFLIVLGDEQADNHENCWDSDNLVASPSAVVILVNVNDCD